MQDVAAVLGRTEVLDRCRVRLDRGGGLLLYGPAGIGKTTLVDALAAEAASAGTLVLRSTPSVAESELPYLALADLFGGVMVAAGPVLPTPQRVALDTALLRRVPAPGSRVDPLAVRLAVVELLRYLTTRRGVLLVLDDAQWIDQASFDVLAFAARRLTGGRLRVLAAERTTGPPARTAVVPAPEEEFELGPLSEDVLADLLRARLDVRLVGPGLSRLCAASDGNPFYALELGRSLRRHGAQPWPDEPLPVPDRLRALVAARLADLPPESGPALLLIALTGRPERVLVPRTDPGVVAAMDAGVLVFGVDGRLRFSHPLLSDLVQAEADPADLRAAHARLAARADDPVERARHQALAADGPSEQLAADLLAAAVVAEDRGAPGTAAELAHLAAGRTVDPALAASRLVTAGWYAHRAGLADRTRAMCGEILAGAVPSARVEARLLLMELSGGDTTGVRTLLAAAEADARGDDRLTGWVYRYRAELAVRETGCASARPDLDIAEELAERCGDTELLLDTLTIRLSVEVTIDPEHAREVLDRGLRLAEGRELTRGSAMLRRYAALATMRAGDLPRAVDVMERLRADVERAGILTELFEVLQLCSVVYGRVGRCADAYATGLLAGQLRMEVEPTPGRGLVHQGTAELFGGTVERAVELLDAAIDVQERIHDQEWLGFGLIARGRADLLLGRLEAAAARLDRARTLMHKLGLTDPAQTMIDAELAETMALTGNADQAVLVLAAARAEAARLQRTSVLLGFTRADCVIEAVSGHPREAADRLRAALTEPDAPPLDIARAWLTLGELEWRARRPGLARVALREAADRYGLAGCRPWHRYTMERLARRDAEGGPASETERRIIELVRAGATNKEIAATLHLSVKAVEANLTKLYRRLGVRNRAGLARTTQ
ncbi:AAA family ATPase [Longispora sp. NPDC051575]|uniref:AAA family ATPase n=1 Tax=Longispora sp. NPDC051575 TaxID=3154943 RepID=UPI003419C9D1